MKLGQMQDGRFFRNVGYLESGSQPKFYLGRDGADAFVRGGKIEQIWRLVVADFQRSERSPHWFGFALDLAKAVTEGRVIAVKCLLIAPPTSRIDRLHLQPL